MLVAVLERLGDFLEAREHRALGAQVLARAALVAQAVDDVLHELELVVHERESVREALRAVIAAQVVARPLEGEQVFEHGGVFAVLHGEQVVRVVVLGEDTPADDLARAGARKRQAGVEPPLNLGEVLPCHGGNLVDGLLARHDHPHAAGALRAQVLDDGLEVEHEACVGAYVLAHLVDHEQQAKLAALLLGALGHVLIDLAHEPIDGELELLGVVEPALCGLATLGARLLEGVDDGVAVEVVGVALVEPFGARDLSIRGAERLGLALLVDVALQARELEVLAVVPEVLEEHAGEDAQDGVFLARTALGVEW